MKKIFATCLPSRYSGLAYFTHIFLACIALLTLCRPSAYADDPGKPTKTCFNYTTRITRSTDNYYEDFSAFDKPVGCWRTYFFPTYVNAPVTVSFDPHWITDCGGDINNPDNYFYSRVTVYLDNNPTPVVIYNPSGKVRTDYYLYNPIHFTPAVKGKYTFLFEQFDPTQGWSQQQTAIFTAIPRIEKAWIEVDPICVDNNFQPPADGKIHFRLKTIPDLASTMFYCDRWSDGLCNYAERIKIDLNCDVNGNPANSIFGNSVLGTQYNTYNFALQNDFWVSYSACASYFTGANRGAPLIINATIQDGVSLNQTLRAPLLINFPAGTATPGSGFGGHASYHSKDYTIPASVASETWTPQSNPAQKMYGSDQSVYKIWQNLSIPPGKILTIRDMQIEFGPQGSIEVQTLPGGNKEGGTLVLDHATLTANHDCGNGNAFWQGVRVWGDGARTQALITGTSTTGNPYASWQGTLNMSNQSKISYASWGIVNTTAAYNSAYTGGVIIASNSTFENNLRAVNYGQYPASGPATAAYRSSFSNCDFRVDASFPTAFIAFIGGWGVKGVVVNGCRFVDNSTLPSAYKHGIGGSDFGVVIDRIKSSVTKSGTVIPAVPTEFKNLRYGVTLQGVSGTATTSIRNTNFYNNTTGVSTDNLPAPQVSYNTFTVPGGTATANSLGIVVNTGSGYGVTHNSFSGMPGATYNTGVNVINTGSSANEVRSNSYSGLWCANLSNWLNRNANSLNPNGLQFLCNANSGNQHDIAARGTKIVLAVVKTDGMAGNQGSASLAAGNSFSSGALWNIYNYTSEVQAINYYHSLISNETPINIYGAASSTASRNECSYPNDNNYDGPIIKAPIGRLRIAYFMNDPEGIPHRDSLYMALADWVSPYSDLTKTDLLIEDGNFAAANATYNAIATTHDLSSREADEFTNWGRRLMDIRIALRQDNKMLKELNPAQVQSLEDIANNAQLWAQVRARNWLSLYDERQFVTDMLFPDNVQQGGGQRMIPGSNSSVYTLAPNPATDQIRISFTKETDADETCTISDVTGRIVAEASLKGWSGNCYIDVHHLQTGIYLYRITNEGTVKSAGKISKN